MGLCTNVEAAAEVTKINEVVKMMIVMINDNDQNDNDNNKDYYTTSSVSGQDEPNPAL